MATAFKWDQHLLHLHPRCAFFVTSPTRPNLTQYRIRMGAFTSDASAPHRTNSGILYGLHQLCIGLGWVPSLQMLLRLIDVVGGSHLGVDAG